MMLILCPIHQSRNHEMGGFSSNQLSWQKHTLFVVLLSMTRESSER
jgi:hypothetical protein